MMFFISPYKDDDQHLALDNLVDKSNWQMKGIMVLEYQ